MMFANLELAKRLETAEGIACREFAAARKRLFPDCGSEWMEHAGGIVVYDGIASPCTQTFRLGLLENLTAGSLEVIEGFFVDRGAPVLHEVSPFCGPETLALLCARGYQPFEISTVLFRAVEKPAAMLSSDLSVRVIVPDEWPLWSNVSARGWAHEHPEFFDSAEQFGAICATRERSPCFLGEIDGEPGAAGSLCIHEGVALFAGAATVPELRRRGLQSALLNARMRYAYEQGCDLAMMVAEAGSNSQRNAERQGFRVAYTRFKWRLNPACIQ